MGRGIIPIPFPNESGRRCRRNVRDLRLGRREREVSALLLASRICIDRRKIPASGEGIEFSSARAPCSSIDEASGGKVSGSAKSHQ